MNNACSCPYSAGVVCSGDGKIAECRTCGWNPEVHSRRVAALKQQMEDENNGSDSSNDSNSSV